MTTVKKLTKCLGVLSVVLVGACGMTGHEPYKTSGEQVDDMWTVRQIKSRLGRIEEGDIIHVAIDRGIVQLSGFVKTSAIRKEADRVTSQTKGVSKVINNIIVRTTPSYKAGRMAIAGMTEK